jgi:hypothetical protein
MFTVTFLNVTIAVKIQRLKKVDADYIYDLLWKDLPPDQTGLRKLRGLFTNSK